MRTDDDVMPAIHTWWPHLTIEAKHALVEATGATLSDQVVAEIQQITGMSVDQRVLGAGDVAFIRTQRQIVD